MNHLLFFLLRDAEAQFPTNQRQKNNQRRRKAKKKKKKKTKKNADNTGPPPFGCAFCWRQTRLWLSKGSTAAARPPLSAGGICEGLVHPEENDGRVQEIREQLSANLYTFQVASKARVLGTPEAAVDG